jgi:hypothetical protein
VTFAAAVFCLVAGRELPAEDRAASQLPDAEAVPAVTP